MKLHVFLYASFANFRLYISKAILSKEIFQWDDRPLSIKKCRSIVPSYSRARSIDGSSFVLSSLSSWLKSRNEIWKSYITISSRVESVILWQLKRINARLQLKSLNSTSRKSTHG